MVAYSSSHCKSRPCIRPVTSLTICSLFNAFQAFGELASTMMGRGIINKHRAFAFHRPSALWIAQIAVDMVFSSAQILLFSIIVYFMCGLVLSAGAFFTFFLLIVSGYLAMTLFFRTVGCLCPDFDYAMKFAAVIITLFVLTSVSKPLLSEYPILPHFHSLSFLQSPKTNTS